MKTNVKTKLEKINSQAYNWEVKIGELGEKIAKELLKEKGWKIIETNHWSKQGEIDIVAKDLNKILVFVEVKTLKGLEGDLERENLKATFKPEDHFDYKKIKKLRQLSSFYANSHRRLVDEEKGWRIDLIAIIIYDKQFVYNHYENVA